MKKASTLRRRAGLVFEIDRRGGDDELSGASFLKLNAHLGQDFRHALRVPCNLQGIGERHTLGNSQSSQLVDEPRDARPVVVV